MRHTFKAWPDLWLMDLLTCRVLGPVRCIGFNPRSQSAEGDAVSRKSKATRSSLRAPGGIGAQGTGSKPRLRAEGAEEREGFLKEGTPELGVNQIERERRDNQIHEIENCWLLGLSKGRLLQSFFS